MVINQYRGIGDLLFIEPIARHLRADVIVDDSLLWINDYVDYSCIKRSKAQKIYNLDSEVMTQDYLPLRFANPVIRNLNKWDYSDFENCMMDKYIMADSYSIRYDKPRINKLKWNDLKINFNISKAKNLYSLIRKNDIIVNEYSSIGGINIPIEGERIKFLKDYNVLDWIYVISKAKEFHTVSTCWVYILQAMYNQGFEMPDIYIYPRPNEDGLRGIKNLNFDYKCQLVQ